MDTELKTALDAHGAAIDAAIAKFDGQIAENGKADNEIRNEVKALSERFESQVTELAQKMEKASVKAAEVVLSPGAEFIKSDAYKALCDGRVNSARVEVKNTVVADGNSTFPDQRPGVIAGSFAPLTLRQIIPTINVTSNAVNALKETVWTNNAAETAQAAAKPESALTLAPYNVVIQTVAHFIKVSNQLVADAPAVMAYIDVRLRDGLAQRVDKQLLIGDGTAPNLSGLTDTGNFTAFTAGAGATLAESINKAKYQLWAAGEVADVAIVNPADWGAMEVAKGTDGHYLYGLPGVAGGMNPFGVQIVLNANMPAGFFLVGNVRGSATIYQRQGATVEMGYVNDDFTKNLVTIRAEERLGLGVDRPAAILYGDYSA